jgi:citrate synthase
MPKDTLTVTDNRTGLTYELPIEEGAIRAPDLRQIKVSDDDFGLMSYDPAFLNTASCRSTITYIDGDRGIPTAAELEVWTHEITFHTFVHENVKSLMEGFRYDAHPMGMLVSVLGALSTFYPEAAWVDNADVRMAQVYRLIAKVPTIAAWSYRHSRGLPYVYPDNDLGFVENFLSMMFKIAEPRYEADPAIARALEVLFILHADHEQNCSANAMRSIGSSRVDPYSALAGAAAALFGPLHGGANEEVLKMLAEIGDVKRVPEYVERVKAGEFKLMGFGHRVYKNYDPRAKIIKQVADEVFEVTGRNPWLDVALELEKIALEDEYFVSRKLYPNVDFYSGIIYQALGLPVAMFPVMFAIPRTSGWLAQWLELIDDPEQKIARPRQLYVGAGERDYLPVADRKAADELVGAV